MIRYFWELVSWEETVEKAIDVEVKILLQPPSRTRKIDLKSPQGNQPVKIEEKDSGRTKSTNTPSADVSSDKYQQFSIHSSQIGKKDQDQGDSWRRGG